MKTLYILRHGDSGFDAPTDFDRVLSAEGRRAVAEVAARWAEGLDDASTLQVECSAARRAHETALIALEALGQEQAPSFEPRPDLYLAGFDTWLAVLRALPEAADACLFVGHNPGLSHLVQRLSPANACGLSTAALVTLTWNINDWQLADSVEPDGFTIDQPHFRH